MRAAKTQSNPSSMGAVPLVLAAIYGFVYSAVVTEVWRIYTASSPINDWLVTAFSQNGQRSLYLLAVYSQGLIVNVFIALPFAWLIDRLRPNRCWIYLVTGLLVANLAKYRAIAIEPEILALLLGSMGSYVSALTFLLALPLAFASLPRKRRRTLAPTRRARHRS